MSFGSSKDSFNAFAAASTPTEQAACVAEDLDGTIKERVEEQAKIVLRTGEEVSEHYILGQPLHRGSFATVLQGMPKDKRQRWTVGIKSIDKDRYATLRLEP